MDKNRSYPKIVKSLSFPHALSLSASGGRDSDKTITGCPIKTFGHDNRGIGSRKRRWGALLGILLVVFLAYLPSLRNQFVNWDDEQHLLGNPFLRSLDAGGLRDIFTTTVYKIYIPLTTLSFAIEYRFFQFNAFVYHLDNLLLHLAVTAMVFAFALQLGCSRLASVAAALLFGLHPLHVESVAWVTERKDVLYAFFYMAGLLFIINTSPLWPLRLSRGSIVFSPAKPSVSFPSLCAPSSAPLRNPWL